MYILGFHGGRKREDEDNRVGFELHDSAAILIEDGEIVAAVGADRTLVDAERVHARAEAERRLKALAPTPQDFQGPTLEAKLELKQAAGRLAHDWATAVAEEWRVKSDLDAFKRRHNLRRQAFYPRSALLQAGLLFCAALFSASFSSCASASAQWPWR